MLRTRATLLVSLFVRPPVGAAPVLTACGGCVVVCGLCSHPMPLWPPRGSPTSSRWRSTPLLQSVRPLLKPHMPRLVARRTRHRATLENQSIPILTLSRTRSSVCRRTHTAAPFDPQPRAPARNPTPCTQRRGRQRASRVEGPGPPVAKACLLHGSMRLRALSSLRRRRRRRWRRLRTPQCRALPPPPCTIRGHPLASGKQGPGVPLLASRMKRTR